MVPMVLQAGLGNVLAGDDAGHPVVSVQHDQVPQTHRAEKTGIVNKRQKSGKTTN